MILANFVPVCGLGEFMNDNGECEGCGIGDWNDEYNQTECQSCTGGRTTQRTGTQSEQGCGK